MTDKPKFHVIADQDDHTEFYDWLKQGQEQGWCSEPVCPTHDLLPTEEWEDELIEEGDDLCQTAVRLYGPYAPHEPTPERVFTIHTNNE